MQQSVGTCKNENENEGDLVHLLHQFRHQACSADPPVYRSSSPHRPHQKSLIGDLTKKLKLHSVALKQQMKAVGGEEREERKIGQTRLDVKNLVLSQGGAERYIIHLGHGA